MNTRTRIMILVSVLLLAGVYFTPIWNILLEAPQYPETLQMSIHINRISGDLNTINGLNHYIGMKVIDPDSIAELKLMPYILGLMIFVGIAVFFSGRRFLLYIYFALLIIMAITGAVDFYLWEYDYGHNLSPDAIIKVPGMNYQPPFIGSKKLLNFTAYSLPDIGAYLAFAAGLLALAAVFFEMKSSRNKK